VPMADNVKPRNLARGTPGFSGADLANLVNEAALFAARANKKLVDMLDFERAKDKIMMGAERRSMVMSDDEKALTAYHEAGHAIVGLSVPDHDPVYKVTIIPRGRALGVTMFLPEQDRYSHSKRRLESQISSLFGGRIAEEIVFGSDSVTTGASNDIERATDIARNMVTKWGLSDELGPLLYGSEDQDPFGYGGGAAAKAMSEETQKRVDAEVRSIIDECYKRAFQTLEDNRDILDSMCEALMKYETIGSEQIDQLMARTEVSPPEGWSDMPERDAEAAPKSQAAQAESEPEEAESTDADSDMPNGDDAPTADGDKPEGEEPKA